MALTLDDIVGPKGEPQGQTLEEITGIAPAPTLWERVKSGAAGIYNELQTDLGTSVFQRGQTVEPSQIFSTDLEANRRARDFSNSPTSVMFTQANQADKNARIEKQFKLRDTPADVAKTVIGSAAQLSDMSTSVGKQLLGSSLYAGAFVGKRLTGLAPAQAAKEAQAWKDMWPEELATPWAIAFKAAGQEEAYTKNPVAAVMGKVSEVINKGVETTASKLGIPAEHLANLVDGFMGVLGVKALKPGVVKAVHGRLAEFAGMPEPKVRGTFGAELGAELGARGEQLGMPRGRTLDEIIRTPVADLTEPIPEAPTKAELKAQKEAVDSLVVDKEKLKEIFGIATQKGPAAEAALVQNLFDRVYQPVKRVELPPREVGTVPEAVIPAADMTPALQRALDNKAAGVLLTGAEAKLLRDTQLPIASITPLVSEAIGNLREGKLITAEQAKAVRTLGVDTTRGTISGPDGKVWFTRGQSTPEFLGVLAAMGVGALAIPHIVDWWNKSGGLSGDNSGDIGMALAGAGAAGVMKPKGGIWHPFAMSELARPLTQSLLPPLVRAGLEDSRYTISELGKVYPEALWAQNVVTKWLNKEAGTEFDRAKNIILPDGQTLESVTDQAFGKRSAGDYMSKNVLRNPDILKRPSYSTQSAIPGLNRLAAEGKVRPEEPIYQVGSDQFIKQYGHQGTNVAGNVQALKSYLGHVGDYIKSLNLTPDKLQQYDLPRAMQETAANDTRIAAEALKDFIKSNPTRIADSQAMPEYKSYEPVKQGKREFSFNRDGSIRKMESVDLPPGEVQYSWREIKLPDQLTPEQLSRIKQTAWGREAKDGVSDYTAHDAKGKVIIDNFTRKPATRATPQEAHLAGQLAQEGRALGHCVGKYVDGVLNGESRILTLRDQHGRSYATVELVPGRIMEGAKQIGTEERIVQIKGPGNGAPADYVQPYIQDLVKSGKWGDVQDLGHTGLIKQRTGEYLTAKENAAKHLPQMEADLAKWERLAKEGGYGREFKTLEEVRYEISVLKDGIATAKETLQSGKARPEHLAKIAAGAGLAAYALSDQPKDPMTMAAMGLAGSVALGKSRFAGMPEPELIKTFRDATGRSKELAAAQIWESTHRQLERTVARWNPQIPAEDIVQMTFEKAFKALAKGPDELGGFRGDAKLSTWLHGIAQRAMFDYADRGEAKAAGMEVRDVAATMDKETDVVSHNEGNAMQSSPELYRSTEDVAAGNDLARRMQDALNKLPDNFRQIFEKVELEGKSYAEVAQELGIPIGTVQSGLSRAKERLQAHFRDYVDPRTGKFQSGKATPDFLIGLGAIAGGAAIGAALGNAFDPEHSVKDSIYGALAGGIFGTAAGRGALKKLAKEPSYALGVISTELANLHPSLRMKGIEHEKRVLQSIDKLNDAILPFMQAVKKLDKADEARVAGALLNSDVATIQSIPALAKTYPAVQATLKTIETSLEGLGRFAEGVTNYFPRIVKDFEGLKQAMKQEVVAGLEKTLLDAEAKMIKKEHRTMTDVERSLVANRYMYAPEQSSFQPGFAKARTMGPVPAHLQQFYEPPVESLLRYMSGAVNDIETAKFFGRDIAVNKQGQKLYTDLDGSIGNLTARLMAEGKLTREGAQKLQGILKARFDGGEKGMHPILGTIRNVTNAALLGNIASTATQVSDSVMTIYHHGLVPTLQALTQKIIGQERVTPKQLGLINHIAEELSDLGPTGRLVHTTMKGSGFHAVDMFAKGLGLNASLLKNEKLVSTPEGQAKFRAKYQSAFGEATEALINDIRSKRMSDDLQTLLFSELSDAQPVSKLEMTQAYLAHPNGRFLYQMKTYMVKQVDIVRRDSYQEIAKGTFEGIARGTKNLAALATLYAVSNIPGDAIKDWIAGREIDLFSTPKLIENIGQTFGINRYAGQQIGQGKVVETLTGMATPPLRVLQDLAKLNEKTVAYVPFVGRPVYDRYLGGNQAREVYETQSANKGLPEYQRKPLSPAARAYLIEKRAAAEKKKQVAR